MCKVKKWITERYLPAYAKEVAYDHEDLYKKKLKEQALEIERLKSYIVGLEAGIKAQRKIQIYNNYNEHSRGE